MATVIVALYQSWTYYVLRKRLGGEEAKTPVVALAETTHSPATARLKANKQINLDFPAMTQTRTMHQRSLIYFACMRCP